LTILTLNTGSHVIYAYYAGSSVAPKYYPVASNTVTSVSVLGYPYTGSLILTASTSTVNQISNGILSAKLSQGTTATGIVTFSDTAVVLTTSTQTISQKSYISGVGYNIVYGGPNDWYVNSYIKVTDTSHFNIGDTITLSYDARQLSYGSGLALNSIYNKNTITSVYHVGAINSATGTISFSTNPGSGNKILYVNTIAGGVADPENPPEGYYVSLYYLSVQLYPTSDCDVIFATLVGGGSAGSFNGTVINNYTYTIQTTSSTSITSTIGVADFNNSNTAVLVYDPNQLPLGGTAKHTIRARFDFARIVGVPYLGTYSNTVSQSVNLITMSLIGTTGTNSLLSSNIYTATAISSTVGTGTISLLDGNTIIATQTATNNIATFTFASGIISAGTHSLRARYDNTNPLIYSNSLTNNILAPAGVSIAFNLTTSTVSVNDATGQDTASITVTGSRSAQPPYGSVTLWDQGRNINLGTVALTTTPGNANATASIAWNAGIAGQREGLTNLYVQYATTDLYNLSSTSTTKSLYVSNWLATSTNVVVTSNLTSISINSSVTLTARLTSANTTSNVTGTMTFYDYSAEGTPLSGPEAGKIVDDIWPRATHKVLGTGTVVNGIATLTTSSLWCPPTARFQARYSGMTNQYGIVYQAGTGIGIASVPKPSTWLSIAGETGWVLQFPDLDNLVIDSITYTMSATVYSNLINPDNVGSAYPYSGGTVFYGGRDRTVSLLTYGNSVTVSPGNTVIGSTNVTGAALSVQQSGVTPGGWQIASHSSFRYTQTQSITTGTGTAGYPANLWATDYPNITYRKQNFSLDFTIMENYRRWVENTPGNVTSLAWPNLPNPTAGNVVITETAATWYMDNIKINAVAQIRGGGTTSTNRATIVTTLIDNSKVIKANIT
jgi:hypothetical protein